MPETFYKHVKHLKIYAYIRILDIMVAIASGGLAFGALSTSKLASACLAAISISLFAVFFLLDKIKNRNCPDYYTVTIFIDDIENTLLKYGADEIADNSYVWFCSISKFHARILILLEDEFDQNTIKIQKRKINHAINKKYNISSHISISDSYEKLRVNLLVVDCDSEGIRDWISKDVEVLLRRTEPIINAAIVLNKGELLFPSLRENVSLNELNKYLAAAEILTRIFCN